MDLLTREEVLKIARKVAGDENVRLDDYELGNKSDRILGYLGKHLALTLYLASAKGSERRVSFVKTYETRENAEDFLGETGIFKREQDFYRIVAEDMKEYVATLDWCPEYQFSKERVLEDLSEKGFEMVDNKLGTWALDNAHLERVLETLASMHATSLLLEEKESKLLSAMYPTIFQKEILYDENKPETPTRKWVTWQIRDLEEGVDYLHKYSYEEKIKIKKNFEREILKIYTLSKKSETYRNVLTHGDMWKNNFLFLYSNEKIPTECRFVDFQFIRYAPPAHDVMHLLHYATKKEARDRKEPKYLKLYYDHLRKRMQDHGIDVEKIMRGEDFMESCKEYKELALIQSLLGLHYILGPATLKIKMDSYKKYEDYLTDHRKTYMNKFFHDESYADKISDTFHELIDTYMLKK